MAGSPGGAHDNRVFLYPEIAKQPHEYLASGEYLLADSAYPVSEITVAPCKKPAALKRENETFNLYHSRTRIAAEHTIGILKGRFKSLKALRLTIRTRKIMLGPFIGFELVVSYTTYFMMMSTRKVGSNLMMMPRLAPFYNQNPRNLARKNKKLLSDVL